MREQLLENLIKTKVITDENENLLAEYKRYSRNTITPNLFVIILSFLPAYYIMFVITGLIFVIMHIKVNAVFVGLIAIVLAIPFIKVSVFWLNKILLKLRIARKKNRIAEIAEEYAFNLHLMDMYSEVPLNYRYSFCIKSLITYIQNKRADNLKEALNLYELDLKHMEQIDQLKDIQVQQRYMQSQQSKILEEVKAAKSAARRAESAATWARLRH